MKMIDVKLNWNLLVLSCGAFSDEVQQAVMELNSAPDSVLLTREDLRISIDGFQFNGLWPHLMSKIDDFLWMKISGRAGVDDFGLLRSQLIISERIYESIIGLQYEFGTFEEWSDGDDQPEAFADSY